MPEYDGTDRSPQEHKAPRRVARRQLPETGAVFVADCSGSMESRDGARIVPGARTVQLDGDIFTECDESQPRRIDRLAQVLGYLLSTTRLQGLVCFADFPQLVELTGRVQLPEPSGGTALHLALDFVGRFSPAPRKVFVLTDGWPNSRELALEAGRRLRPAVLDAFFVGAEGDREALAFMEQLAKTGGEGGRSGQFDLSDPSSVAAEIRILLTDQRR